MRMMDCRYCRLRHACDDYRYYDDWCCNKFTFDTSLSVDDVCGRKKQSTTNADHIRSMTDEELAKSFVKLHTTCDICAYKNLDCEEETLAVGCVKGITEWLKQPKENTDE